MSAASVSIAQIGTGAVGTVIARHLAASPRVSEIRLADVDEPLAQRVTRSLGSSKATALGLDAGDVGAVARAIRGVDLVVNAAVPRFNRTIQAAAREAGVDYLDLASDGPDPYADGPQWERAGVTGIIGFGEDPGVSNVMARYAADRLDHVESIRIRDGDTAVSPDYPFLCLFSPETFIGETIVPSRIWRDGRYEPVPPFGAKETYVFPEPVGPQPVYSVDHEETESLPRSIGKGIRYCDFKLALDDRTVRVLETFRDLGLFDPKRTDRAAARRAILEIIPKPADLVGRVEGSAALVVEVEGAKDGQKKRLTLSAVLSHGDSSRRFGATATSYFTGTGGAVGALLVATRAVPVRPGLFAPEQLEPDPFLPALRSLGVDVRVDERPIPAYRP